jgi:hypothetical protein
MNRRRLEFSIFLVENALDIVQSLSTKAANETGNCGYAHELNLDEKTAANLEHLLLRVRHALWETVVSRLEAQVQSEASDRRLHWKRQLKLGGDKWCSEFSSSRRPLSTTWPWSIRPSLAVLWGVCWMFYPPRGGDQGEKRMSWQEVLDTQAAFDRARASRAAQGM